MSWSLRRGIFVLLSLVALGSVAWIQSVHAQRIMRVRRPPMGGGAVAAPVMVAPQADGGDLSPDAFDHSGITLPKDEKRLADKIQAAHDYTKDENWPEVVQILQKLVEIPTDVYALIPRKRADGKEVPTWMSVRTEADRLIGELPPNGLDFYKLTFGPRAADMLKTAKETGDWKLLAQAAQRYRHTDAGAEARLLLASHQLDRGDYTPAFRIYKSLLDNAGKNKLPPSVLVRIAMAAHVAGGKDGEATEKQAWKLLREQTREVALGGRNWPVDELEEAVSRRARASYAIQASDSPMYRSNPSRSNLQVGGPAFLERQWFLSSSWVGDDNAASASDKVTECLQQAENVLRSQNKPLLTASFPITAVGMDRSHDKVPLVVFRGHGGIHAVNLRSGKSRWQARSDWSLDDMLNNDQGNAQRSTALNNWLQFYVQQGQRPEIVFENSVVGSLSADSNFVYAVEDLAVPPPGHALNVNPGFPQQGGVSDADTNAAIQHNQLVAYSLARDGALEWRLGSKEGEELADSYFLGPPLPLDGRIYVLVEKQQEVRLVCLDPTVPEPRPNKNGRLPMTAKVLSSQTLGTTTQKLQQDVIRRTTAAHLAYGEGILVCPTNAGAIFAINLLENSLVWTYPYRSKSDANLAGPKNPNFPGGVMPGGGMGMMGGMQQPGFSASGQWKVSAPVIQDGKVVFTAPDARDIHCVNMRDGSRLWARPRQDDDLYMAGVYNGKVLIVGKKYVRALNLSTGEPAWQPLELGLPSGQGVASDNVYYLPLQRAARSKEPEIVAIDIDRGADIAHTRARKFRPEGKEEEIFDVPGNLLFAEGLVLSQTAWELVAYPQLKEKIRQMDDLLVRNPNDPLGLTERGILRLDKGDLPGAIADLSRSLKSKPDAKTRSKARGKLYETLTEYIQHDFNAAQEYLDEYEDLCRVEIAPDATAQQQKEAKEEEMRRRANYLCLVGKGREAQGKLVEAFEKYQKFGEVTGSRELVSVIDEPALKAAPDVWSRGRIAAMIAHATPEQRKPLEELINRRWKDVENTTDLDQLRNFVRVFGSLSAAGNEARFVLVERLMTDGPSKERLIEAERELSFFRGPHEDRKLAARAVEALARLYKRKQLFEDAAYCYRLLGSKYADVVIRDGKTGKELSEEGYMDRRTVGYMDEPAALGGKGSIQVEEDRQGYPFQQNIYHFDHDGEPLPFFRQQALVLQTQTHQLKMIDRKKDKDAWVEQLSNNGNTFQILVGQQVNNPRAHFPYRTMGHLMVLPLGTMVYGIDPFREGKKVIWEKNLLGSNSGPHGQMPGQQPHTLIDPRDNSILVAYSTEWAQRLGETGQLHGATLCMQTREALMAVDPVSGRELWKRSDVNAKNHLITDGQYVYVVELMGNNVPSSTRVFRLSDGVTVKAPDFATIYQKRLRVIGSQILVADTGPTGKVILRLYDMRTGQDTWKQEYPARSIVLDSQEETLGGAVEPSGKIHMIDLATGKELVQGEISTEADANHMQNVHAIHLLADDRFYYLACQKQPDPNVQRFGGVQPNVMPGSGMRSLPVNGYIYAFDRKKGTLAWNSEAPNQMLMLTEWKELPFLLLASRQQVWQNQAPRNMITPEVNVLVIEKRTGKVCYPPGSQSSLPPNGFFHTLRIEPRASKVELIGTSCKLTFHLNAARPRRRTTEPASDNTSRADPIDQARINRRRAALRQAHVQPIEVPGVGPVER